MTSLTIMERSLIAQTRLDYARRRILARLLLLPIFNWVFAAPTAEQLLLVPQELRTCDTSFVSEIEHGMFGLGGTVASMGNGSIFDIKPSQIWAHDLHGFSWLRHLSTVGSEKTIIIARHFINEWIERYGSWEGLPWQPDVVGRRIFSWIANTEHVLGGSAPDFYDKFLKSLSVQMKFLSSCWFSAAVGPPRLTALIGLTVGDFCISGREEFLRKSERYLELEVERQFFIDGGHISRNPHFVVDALLDLIPLRSCYCSFDRPLPEKIAEAIPRMLRFLHFMRLGDGSLARFHGAGTPPFHTLAMLSAYADTNTIMQVGIPNIASQSGYIRLTGGNAILMFDGSRPPPMQFAANAASCCLSFEFSIGAYPIFVNNGTPTELEKEWLARSRATASHNTLVLGAQSSSEIINHRALLRLLGNAPIKLPEKVSINVEGDDKCTTLVAQHDGYLSRFGFLHRRKLQLAKSGHWLAGRDQIISSQQKVRLPHDISFSIHFHLHPIVRCLSETSSVILEIILPNNSLWRFTAKGATLSVEESIYYADLIGPTHTQQIVLRGSCFKDQTVHWCIEKVR